MREHLSIAEEIERDRLCLEAHYETQVRHDEELAARDRADELAPLPARHPWRADETADPEGEH